MQHIVSILSIQDVTHDVRAYRLEKPPEYRFVPGQATDVAMNKEGWREEKHHKTPGDIIYHEELDTILGNRWFLRDKGAGCQWRVQSRPPRLMALTWTGHFVCSPVRGLMGITAFSVEARLGSSLAI